MVSWAQPLHDWRDLDGVHSHIVEAIKEMQIASAANSYDMEGHARKAELLLRDAEKELKYAEDSARRGNK
jgi:hypothetical protein